MDVGQISRTFHGRTILSAPEHFRSSFFIAELPLQSWMRKRSCNDTSGDAAVAANAANAASAASAANAANAANAAKAANATNTAIAHVAAKSEC